MAVTPVDRSPITHLIAILIFLFIFKGCSDRKPVPWPGESQLVPVDTGWAMSSVNAVIFRGNSIASQDSTQFISWYDENGHVMLAKRTIGSDDNNGNEANNVWEISTTPYDGDITDAHNAISIALDGEGYLHMAWGLHDDPLNYVRSLQPYSMELSSPMSMTGQNESAVTYPQFTRLSDGGLVFTYREGGSGNGNLMVNRYDVNTQNWTLQHHPLIDGEGVRNAYINPLVVDVHGNWHISWNWRGTPDVASNHNIAYAWSPDAGTTWLDSSGNPYTLPITYETAEIAWEIPQNSDLINQTSMSVDSDGNPFITTYWRPEGDITPQYHLIWRDGHEGEWHVSQIGIREEPYSLSGYGTQRIPLSRPLSVTGTDNTTYVIFRDFERSGGVTVAKAEPPSYSNWTIAELDTLSVGLWEPTHDPNVWTVHGELHLFHQKVGQGENETLEDVPAQPVSVLEWIP